MAKYRAKADLFVDENPGVSTPVLIKAGTEFTSSRVPGKNWEPLDAAGRSAAVAQFGATAVPASVAAKAAAKPVTAREKAAAKRAEKQAEKKAEADADAEAAAEADDADLKL